MGGGLSGPPEWGSRDITDEEVGRDLVSVSPFRDTPPRPTRPYLPNTPGCGLPTPLPCPPLPAQPLPGPPPTLGWTVQGTRPSASWVNTDRHAAPQKTSKRGSSKFTDTQMAPKLEKGPQVPVKRDESREGRLSHQLANTKRWTVSCIGLGGDKDRDWGPSSEGMNWDLLWAEQFGRRHAHSTLPLLGISVTSAHRSICAPVQRRTCKNSHLRWLQSAGLKIRTHTGLTALHVPGAGSRSQRNLSPERLSPNPITKKQTHPGGGPSTRQQVWTLFVSVARKKNKIQNVG